MRFHIHHNRRKAFCIEGDGKRAQMLTNKKKLLDVFLEGKCHISTNRYNKYRKEDIKQGAIIFTRREKNDETI